MNTSNMYRDKTMEQMSEELVGDTVRLAGWVENIRDHGGVSFVDLRDMYGVMQVVMRDTSLRRLSSAQQTLAFQTSLPLQAASGKRDSNSRPQPWQGCALPTELFPLFNFGCKYTTKTIQCKLEGKKQ